MTEERLDSRELDEIVARGDDDAAVHAVDGGSASARVARVLRHPVVALLAILLAVGGVLGLRSFVVNRPPPLATTVDAEVGATIGDTGFIHLDDQLGITVNLVLRVPSGTPVSALDFHGPGLRDVVVHQDATRVVASGVADCSSLPRDDEASAADYRLRVATTDAWAREVRAEVALPPTMARQIGGTLRTSCLVAAVRRLELVSISPQGEHTTVAVITNHGTEPLYLTAVWLGSGRLDSIWAPPSAATLPATGLPTEVTLHGPIGGCHRSQPPDAAARVAAQLALDVASTGSTSALDWALVVPPGSGPTTPWLRSACGRAAGNAP